MPTRPFLLLRTGDQWLRCAHSDTALDLEHGVVQLASRDEPADTRASGTAAAPAGLALDSRCRLYHGVTLRPASPGIEPRAPGIDIVLWAALEPERRDAPPAARRPFVAHDPVGHAGDFAYEIAPALKHPRGFAIDATDRLFVADPLARAVFIFDIARVRLLRRLEFTGEGGGLSRPMDVAAEGEAVYVLLSDPPGVAMLRARRPPRRIPLPVGVTLDAPSRLAIAPPRTVVILDGSGNDARLVSFDATGRGTTIVTSAPFASDIEALGAGLVVARRPNESFLRYADAARVEVRERLKAAGYDGAGIVRTPDDRIAFWNGVGVAHALSARPRYARSGMVFAYRLDSGVFQTEWGRVFIDACVPPETSVRIESVAADEPPDGPTVTPQLPANITSPPIRREDLSPPLVPLELHGTGMLVQPLRRPNGRELPWTPFALGDSFETYEAPVRAARGRYLWLTFYLSGNGRRTPRFRAVRVEHPGHDYLSRLPKTYSRDEQAASFLFRFLAPIAGVLGETEARAVARLVLVDPWAAPSEILPWLAGFVGLVLDERITICRRRQLIAEAVPLLRMRGTKRGLRRFIEIAIGIPVHVIEHFTLRGFGGPILGYSAADAPTRSVLGSGFRIGGATDILETDPLAGDVVEAVDRRAHRFTVVVPGSLSAEERGIVEHIIRIHRPAHTVGSLCTAGAGMRASVGLHVGLTSVVGRTGAFNTAFIGDWHLGRATLLGQAIAGTRPAASRVGGDTRVG